MFFYVFLNNIKPAINGKTVEMWHPGIQYITHHVNLPLDDKEIYAKKASSLQ